MAARSVHRKMPNHHSSSLIVLDAVVAALRASKATAACRAAPRGICASSIWNLDVCKPCTDPASSLLMPRNVNAPGTASALYITPTSVQKSGLQCKRGLACIGLCSAEQPFRQLMTSTAPYTLHLKGAHRCEYKGHAAQEQWLERDLQGS